MSWIYPLPWLLARHHQDVVWLVWIAQASITLFAANLPRPIKPVPSHTWRCTAKTLRFVNHIAGFWRVAKEDQFCSAVTQVDGNIKFASEKMEIATACPVCRFVWRKHDAFSQFMMSWCPLIDGWILLQVFQISQKVYQIMTYSIVICSTPLKWNMEPKNYGFQVRNYSMVPFSGEPC